MSSARWTPEQLAKWQTRQPAPYAPPAFERPVKRVCAFWPIVPAPWVRESNRDKFAPRPRVQRYRAFRTEVALRKVWAPTPGDIVVFLMPIPKSWSKRKKESLNGMPHEQVPDIDNLEKALLDACYTNDAHIWNLIPFKFWSDTPGIYMERREPEIGIPFVEHIELAGG